MKTTGFGAVAAMERDGWASLGRWVRRRPDVEPGTQTFAYHGATLPLMIVFTVVSALEVVAVDVMVPWSPAWLWLRVTLLVVGVWGVTFALGMVAGVLVHPHTVGPDGIRIRGGRALDIRLPIPAIARVRAARRTRDGRSVQVEDGVLHLPAASQTTVEIELTEPRALTVPRLGEVTVRAVHLHADDARGFARAAQPDRSTGRRAQ
ncbi:hypothetical protein [Pseudonocardia sp. WMMC193]|uniref:hypothetical protein n=1 Tax=Pseudonocardia sp. WMMC193 TaxID=2911965 RepID=UPI001F2DC4FD|nr:hypothetical protein [Pseudonocardia sp. WMMC193]MCF7550239.1 hypothetical protein [Pseudonocardia sp. WMMC193]